MSPGVGIKLDKVGVLASENPVLKSIGRKFSIISSEMLRLSIVVPGYLELSLFRELIALDITEAQVILVDLGNTVISLLILLIARIEDEGDIRKTIEFSDSRRILELGGSRSIVRI